MAMLNMSTIASKNDDKKMICPDFEREWTVVMFIYSRWVQFAICLVNPNSPYAEHFEGKCVMVDTSNIPKEWGLEVIHTVKAYEATNAFSAQNDGGRKGFAALRACEKQAKALANRLSLVYEDPFEGMNLDELDSVDLSEGTQEG